jgi:ribonucleoside-diphosphate reductase alpha chain
MSSTPTRSLIQAHLRSQLSSCYLTTVPDDLSGIYNAIRDNALLSKYAGGLGNDWTPVRGLNAHIEGTNGKSQGVVPFLKVANDTAVAVNQGGKRKGAVCAYMETWHVDIEEFLELRKNTGDERRRTHDMNTANWIPDLFMKRMYAKEDWTLFSPDEVPELHELFGKAFEKQYLEYERKAAIGVIKNFKKIPAVNLWRKMLGLLFETGHPWITFKDPCNIRSPQQHTGVVHSSNLCTEITLNTSIDEIAVCNLGSINLVNHMKLAADGKYILDKQKLENTINTAVRMLDNVIDINFYAVPQAKNSNLLHRPIGLGLMGFQDALYQLNIPYASEEAINFADESMEYISYYAIKASSDLAKERGSYASYQGSLWSRGILPIDSIELLKNERGGYVDVNTTKTLDWDSLRTHVVANGMRNSNVMAIAPTATISNICGVSQSIEPTYQNLFVKSNLSGEFTVINPYLVADLKAVNLWDNVMVNDLKYFNGSVVNIDRIPTHIKVKYATAFEIEPVYLIDAASRRQKWIDQAQSLNLYMAEASGKKLDNMYKHAWVRGLKTTYYLRSLGASAAEKSTITDGALNAVKQVNAQPTAATCSIDNPDCEACQ